MQIEPKKFTFLPEQRISEACLGFANYMRGIYYEKQHFETFAKSFEKKLRDKLYLLALFLDLL